jgi:hypothetical protein
MAHELSDYPNVVFEMLRTGEGLTHEARDPLPLSMGVPGFLNHRVGLGSWDDACAEYCREHVQATARRTPKSRAAT